VSKPNSKALSMKKNGPKNVGLNWQVQYNVSVAYDLRNSLILSFDLQAMKAVLKQWKLYFHNEWRHCYGELVVNYCIHESMHTLVHNVNVCRVFLRITLCKWWRLWTLSWLYLIVTCYGENAPRMPQDNFQRSAHVHDLLILFCIYYALYQMHRLRVHY